MSHFQTRVKNYFCLSENFFSMALWDRASSLARTALCAFYGPPSSTFLRKNLQIFPTLTVHSINIAKYRRKILYFPAICPTGRTVRPGLRPCHTAKAESGKNPPDNGRNTRRVSPPDTGPQKIRPPKALICSLRRRERSRTSQDTPATNAHVGEAQKHAAYRSLPHVPPLPFVSSPGERKEDGAADGRCSQTFHKP